MFRGMDGVAQWYLFWAIAYVAFAWFFMFAAMPLLNTRNSLLDMPPYAVAYWAAGVWVLAGLIGHTPWWQTLFDWQADVPVSLLMPLFWTSLSILLFCYLLHYLLQWLLLRLAGKRRCRRFKFCHWLHRGIRTKSRCVEFCMLLVVCCGSFACIRGVRTNSRWVDAPWLLWPLAELPSNGRSASCRSRASASHSCAWLCKQPIRWTWTSTCSIGTRS